MDDFSVELVPSYGKPGAVIVRVLINGSNLADPDYYLNIDTFFSAVGEQKAAVEFIGGCGIEECCGISYQTFSTPFSWQWADFHFRWDEVYEAARIIVDHIEQLMAEKKELLPGRYNLEFYKQKLCLLISLSEPLKY